MLACVICLSNFTFWEETTNRMKTFPKTHQAPVLGEDRSCGLRVPPTQLGRCSTKGTWGDLGGRLLEMSGMVTECNPASSKMDGRIWQGTDQA